MLSHIIKQFDFKFDQNSIPRAVTRIYLENMQKAVDSMSQRINHLKLESE